MSFPLTRREAYATIQDAVDATKVWVECPDCKGCGECLPSSGDPQYAYVCHTCEGERYVEGGSIINQLEEIEE